MRIGILALQGGFEEHQKMLTALGADTVLLKTAGDLQQPLDGVILPGGESTAMARILRDQHMLEDLAELLQTVWVYATCAGMILLSEEVEGGETSLSLVPIRTVRNAYGRQLGSFETKGKLFGKDIPLVFIRAPYFRPLSEEVEVLLEVEGKAVAGCYGHYLFTSFHPELREDLTVHKAFLRMIQSEKKGR